jgi:hypothetical protein
MWPAMANGDHFDYTRATEDPIYPNVAKRAAASRELHFQGGKEWLEYNSAYGAAIRQRPWSKPSPPTRGGWP